MFAVPASALVVRVVRADIEPAPIVTRLGTDAMLDWSEVSWTMTSELEVAGVPDDVSRSTSSTL
jgi:hypothetical protein